MDSGCNVEAPDFVPGSWSTEPKLQRKLKVNVTYISQPIVDGGIDEYTNRIPKYTKVKVLSTQDKQHISWAASQSYTATAAAL